MRECGARSQLFTLYLAIGSRLQTLLHKHRGLVTNNPPSSRTYPTTHVRPSSNLCRRTIFMLLQTCRSAMLGGPISQTYYPMNARLRLDVRVFYVICEPYSLLLERRSCMVLDFNFISLHWLSSATYLIKGRPLLVFSFFITLSPSYSHLGFTFSSNSAFLILQLIFTSWVIMFLGIGYEPT
ncbi:hypothetical protein BDN70DRAFT_527726 [Pholiota conissans]|uniref:Uncharacterized protein n=1 Tax=Pholiota conissans TaxID=109636 RepID=A0A9P5YMD4_9AGAR|nr:hypothetical protein BDN70DRAFT_527726 [Pholiota conissans]